MLPKPILKLKTGKKSTYFPPIVCAAGLLVILGLMVIPLGSDEASATDGDSSIVEPSEDNATGAEENDGVMPMSLNPTVDMVIGGDAVDATVGAKTSQVAYRAHTLTVSSSDVKSYSLHITGPVGLDGETATYGAAGATPSTMADNTWGFAYGETVDKSNMHYASFTGTEQTIDSGTTAPNFTKNLVFAAKFGEDAKVGHYTASVILSLVAEAKTVVNYSITYDANGGSNPPSSYTYDDESGSTTHTTTVSTMKPTRAGYEFAGWATSAGGGVSYQPGASITLSDTAPNLTLYAVWSQQYTYTITYNANGGSNPPSSQSQTTTATSHTFTVAAKGGITKNGYAFLGWAESSSATSAQYTAGSSQLTLRSSSPSKTLYAVWQKNVFDGITNMNQLTTSICKSAAVGDSKTLKDTSADNNNKSYTVTKLKDNNCWMTENMNNSTGRSYEDSRYGGYYTSSGAQSVCTQMGEGWQLPTNDQYSTLTNDMDYDTITTSPYSFLLGGYFNQGSSTEVGTGGFYWTDTHASGSLYHGFLQIKSSGVSLSNYKMSYAMSVRCLALGS